MIPASTTSTRPNWRAGLSGSLKKNWLGLSTLLGTRQGQPGENHRHPFGLPTGPRFWTTPTRNWRGWFLGPHRIAPALPSRINRPAYTGTYFKPLAAVEVMSLGGEVAREVQVRWPGGKTTTGKLPEGAKEIRVTADGNVERVR